MESLLQQIIEALTVFFSHGLEVTTETLGILAAETHSYGVNLLIGIGVVALLVVVSAISLVIYLHKQGQKEGVVGTIVAATVLLFLLSMGVCINAADKAGRPMMTTIQDLNKIR